MSSSAPPSAPSGAGVYLGLDYGARRIGIAVGETLTGAARPLPMINNAREPDWAALDRAVREWRPRAFVVGLPLSLDGEEQAITAQARNFGAQLEQRFGLAVHWCDERLSSRAADDELRSARASGRLNRRVRSGDRDGVAARLILEQWFALGANSGPA